jgi:putative zinc finger protein
MQHLDEGTIHSWLDGALDSEEAASVAAHVGECPECAATVAEARGFIAASSRILTALDNAPRGVIPAAAPRKRIDPFVWRVAATVVVVAVGTLVVFQNRGSDMKSASVTADTALLISTPNVGEGAATATTPAPTTRAATPPTANAQVDAATEAAPRTVVGKAPSLALSKQSKVDDERRADNAREKRAPTVEAGGMAGQRAAVTPGYTGAAAPTAPEVTQSLAAGAVAMDLARETERLKVVSTPRRIGAKVTLYEVAPGDTVTLTEATMTAMDYVVTTGANAAAKAGRTERSIAPQSVARPSAAAAAAQDSQRGAVLQSAPVSTPTPAPPAPVSMVEVANGVTTISWTDATTRNVLKLSGRMPAARLQQIKILIERERTAAAKKTP